MGEPTSSRSLRWSGSYSGRSSSISICNGSTGSSFMTGAVASRASTGGIVGTGAAAGGCATRRGRAHGFARRNA